VGSKICAISWLKHHPGLKCEGNENTNMNRRDWSVRNWIYVSMDADFWRAAVSAVLNFLLGQECGIAGLVWLMLSCPEATLDCCG
jgi:hypothetical protein